MNPAPAAEADTASARPVSDETYANEVLAALRARLRAVAAESPLPLAEALGPADELADRLAAVVPSPSPFAAVVGPVYRQASLARAADCSRQAVHEMVRARRVLALRTADGVLVIPAFQLDDRFRPLPGLADVLAVLDEDVVDPWSLASWLTAPQARLDGHSVVDHLRGGGSPAAALAVAEHARARWVR